MTRWIGTLGIRGCDGSGDRSSVRKGLDIRWCLLSRLRRWLDWDAEGVLLNKYWTDLEGSVINASPQFGRCVRI